MPKRIGRNDELYRRLISFHNLYRAINEVNRTHRWLSEHRPNKVTAWVELTRADRVNDLRKIISEGFEQQAPHVTEHWDDGAQKMRTISEPKQWPDQYVHHALIQVLQPVMMRGMDYYCCGSICHRGTHREAKAITKWMDGRLKGTEYCLSCDIRKFYDTLKPEMVMERMRGLIKDRRVLDLIWRVIKDGIKIGFYTSQWFANTYLQPLDQLIRQHPATVHYARYMDNITIFGSNKRKLKRLRAEIQKWLVQHGLGLKDDWQVFLTTRTEERVKLAPPRRGYKRSTYRMPDAVGYRYGRGYTIPRKRNFLKMKRVIARYLKKKRQRKEITFHFAAGLLSRIGSLKHCNNVNLYRYLFNGRRIQRELKQVVRRHQMEGILEWNTYLEQVKATRQF